MSERQTVELFCGTKSFSKVAEEFGYRTYTIDINEDFEPDLCENILEIEKDDLFENIDILWASPPCTRFSVASIGKSWCGNYCPKTTETALGMSYVLKTLELIKETKPKNWFIENPRGVLRKMAFMEGLERKTITYCQYGDNRMKPTDIWTNCTTWKPKPMCKNGSPCHVSAPRGSKTGTQGIPKIQRSIVPKELIEEILEATQ